MGAGQKSNCKGEEEEGGEMLVISTLLLLRLTPITWAAIPSFLANLEEDSTYHKCDSAMCWWTTFDIEIDSDFSVPNSSLVVADYRWDWWEVKMSSLLEECAPSLPLSQIAYSFSACNNIEDESVKEACIAVQRDWLDEKGAIKTTLIQTYSELPKAESFINECLALGGADVSEVEEIFDYYDYSDYYDNDDYNWVEEKIGGRNKRSLEGKLKARVKEREERRGMGRKGQRGGKVVEKKRTGKSQRPKGGQKRRTPKERNGPKKKKTQKNKTKKKQKERARKGKKKTKPSRQTSKKKKKKAKQALKKIGLKKTPSKLILAQVKCIWLAVDLALEDCGKSVLKNSNIGNL